MPHKDVSVIIALNNEEGSVELLCSRIRAVFLSVDMTYELILVDDGSDDMTYVKMCDIYSKDMNVSIVKLNKKIGQALSFLVGLQYARGVVIITMDGDLQHSPEDIPRFLEKLALGYDVVCGRKQWREDNVLVKTIPSLIAKKIVVTFFGSHIQDINSTFRACRREALSRSAGYGEAIRFLPLLIVDRNALGEIMIDCKKRRTGTTHFSCWPRCVRIIKDVGILWRIRTATLKYVEPGFVDIVESIRSHG